MFLSTLQFCKFKNRCILKIMLDLSNQNDFDKLKLKKKLFNLFRVFIKKKFLNNFITIL